MTLLEELVETARDTIRSGYYTKRKDLRRAPSLVEAVKAARRETQPALIAEIAPATPIRGKVVEGSYGSLMQRFLSEGACGLSVLTEPKHFHGSLAYLRKAVGTGAPTLMRDIFLSEVQIDCAASLGASAVSFLMSVLEPARLGALIEYAHLAEREVLLECASGPEVEAALTTETDLVGVNNLDLRTFRADVDRTRSFTEGLLMDRPLVSLGGFSSLTDVERVRGRADAIVVGSSLIEGRTTVRQWLGE